MRYFRMVCYTVAIPLAIVFGSCAPSAVNKGDTMTSKGGSAGSSMGKSQATGEGSRGKSSESSTGPGSLDALRRGQGTATPGSSPLKDIYFEFDRYDLRADAREILKANADWLRKNPSQRVEIEGHCDERGTNEYNLALGAKRAQSAKDYLLSLGVSGERVSTISYGEEIPTCKDHAESCWSQNRRARFVVIPSRPSS